MSFLITTIILLLLYAGQAALVFHHFREHVEADLTQAKKLNQSGGTLSRWVIAFLLPSFVVIGLVAAETWEEYREVLDDCWTIILGGVPK